MSLKQLFKIFIFIVLTKTSVAQTITQTNLPIIVLTTTGTIGTSNIQGNMKIIINSSGINHPNDAAQFNGTIGIKYRGNVLNPKKSFNIETWVGSSGLSLDTSLLGMPTENDWVLLSSYSDRSFQRDLLGFYFFEQMGNYAPRMRLVEVMLDGVYQGVYLFGEKIKRDLNRVNITKLNSTDNTAPTVTGGYIFKIDNGTSAYWSSLINPPYASSNQKINFHYEEPSDLALTTIQKAYIKSYVDSFEAALNGANFQDTASINGWRNFAGKGSFEEYMITSELMKCEDAYRISTFLYKDMSKKLKIGPPWGLELGLFNTASCNASKDTGWAYNFAQSCGTDTLLPPFWWKRLSEDTLFMKELKCKYTAYRTTFLDTVSLFNKIDSISTLLNGQQALARNFTKWPIWGTLLVNEPLPVSNNYTEEITKIKTFIKNRIAFLDSMWLSPACLILNTTANVTASGSLTLCGGGSVTLTADPASSYSWSNGANTQAITVNTPGVYTVTVTNSIGINSTSSPINVIMKAVPTAVTLSTSSATTVCYPNTITFTNTNAASLTGFDYQWKLNGAPIAGETNTTYTAMNASGGSITLTVSGSTCSKTSAAKSYLIKPLPVASFTAMGATTICMGESVTLTAPTITGYTYTWLKDGTTAGSGTTKAFKLTGLYTVVATLAGCKDTATNGVSIVVNPLPVVTSLTVTPSTICAGQAALLSAIPSNGILYTWVNGNIQTTSPTATYSTGTAGNYKVIIKDANNCVSKAGGSAKLVITPYPIANISAASSTTISSTGSVKLTGSPNTGVTIQWYKNGVAISGAIQKDYTATSSGSYTVGITKSGCTSYSTAIVVTQTGNKEEIGTTNCITMDFEMIAYPNPVNEAVVINILGIKKVDGILEVMDFSGHLVASKEMKQASTTVEMIGLASGIYLIHYKDNKGRIATVKVTKQ